MQNHFLCKISNVVIAEFMEKGLKYTTSTIKNIYHSEGGEYGSSPIATWDLSVGCGKHCRGQ